MELPGAQPIEPWQVVRQTYDLLGCLQLNRSVERAKQAAGGVGNDAAVQGIRCLGDEDEAEAVSTSIRRQGQGAAGTGGHRPGREKPIGFLHDDDASYGSLALRASLDPS